MGIMLTSKKAKQRAERHLRKGEGIVPATIQDDHLFFAANVQHRHSESVVGGLSAIVVDKRDARIFGYCEPYTPAEEALEMQRYRSMEEDSLREAFPHYDMQKNYKVVITQVYQAERLTDLFLSFRLTYVVPEMEAGDIWRIPEQYARDLLHERLIGEPPIQFANSGGGIATWQLEHKPKPFLFDNPGGNPEQLPGNQLVEREKIKARVRQMENYREHGGWRPGDLFDFLSESKNSDLCDFQLTAYAPQKRASHPGKATTEDFQPVW